MERSLVETIEKITSENRFRYDTPGHKAGRGLSHGMRRLIADARWDMTLTNESVEWSNGSVYEAECAAARVWGAHDTLFTLNGSTGALHIALMALFSSADKILIASNCHRAVLNGLVLTGSNYCVVNTTVSESGLDMNVSVDSIAKVLQQERDLAAIIITSPNYYGVAADVRSIARLAKQHGVCLIVDEAHGAHLKFSDDLPYDALTAGADVVVQSTHKMLTALTPGAMLHINNPQLNRDRFVAARQILQTSSPNYAVLASIDEARVQCAGDLPLLLNSLLSNIRKFKQNLAWGNLLCYNSDLIGGMGGYRFDECKLVCDYSRAVASADELLSKLDEQKVVAELIDERHVLFHITVADDRKSLAALGNALRVIGQCKVQAHPAPEVTIPEIEIVLAPRDAYFASRESVRLSDARGMIAATAYSYYPPGVPFLLPGAIVKAATIDYVYDRARYGRYPAGYKDANSIMIDVVVR